MSLAFCAVSTFLTLVIFSITAILSDRHVNRQYLFHVAMRRAFFLSFILIAAAILKLLNAATQGNIILLITAVVALEIYCTEYLK